jgi:hypothetical protein
MWGKANMLCSCFKYLEFVYSCESKPKIARRTSFIPPWFLALEATESPVDSTISSSPKTASTASLTKLDSLIRSPSEEFLRYLKRKQKVKTKTNRTSDTKYITSMLVNVPKLIDEALSLTIEEDTTILVAACVSLVCCIFISMLIIVLVKMKKKKAVKSDNQSFQN